MVVITLEYSGFNSGILYFKIYSNDSLLEVLRRSDEMRKDKKGNKLKNSENTQLN